MIKVLIVFGTRPEVIKLAPVINETAKYPNDISVQICLTGQHREMTESLLKLFNIKPDIDLRIQEENQSLQYITNTVLVKVGEIIESFKPDFLMIQGDTTTAMAASLAGFYNKTKIAHIEAGLRTWNKLQPYPEEVNRKIIDSVSDLFFVHTQKAMKNLLNEGVNESKIYLTGNTVIDALFFISSKEFNVQGSPLESIFNRKGKIVLVTAHRRENFGKPLLDICNALKEIAEKYPDICIVYPVHLNPNVREVVYSELDEINNIFLLPPLNYEMFIHLMKKSYFILTDSGGLQEEAPSLNKPVLVLRKETERPEGVTAGTLKLVGSGQKKIVAETTNLLTNTKEYNSMAEAENPYGDGKASQRIVEYLLKQDRK